ncbi:hypothetical protein [Sphingosinicella sp. BN140058]|uniref:hypothetical protein n=1 Tax=Sphingosinicella sp. BN140058 TaxID=1892855 RepID=UPI0010113AA6|nr:hypothetical protein [Sphingosinicella sp. BN140058]QAY76523.1 hypothetical protein ETR14_08460 [Sphingosinicella sp. BN140058]
MRYQVFFGAAFADAATLIDEYGAEAGREAKKRASRSRDLGNVVHFCRWRETERMIGALCEDAASGAIQ